METVPGGWKFFAKLQIFSGMCQKCRTFTAVSANNRHPNRFLTHNTIDHTMKKSLLPILLLFVFAAAQAQTCVRDSTVLQDTTVISPFPYTPAYPVNELNPACIGQPYSQSFTIEVPAIFVFNGVNLPLTSASIATTGAISGLPAGVTYLCDPPNCVFNANTLGCILLYGTPTPNNTAPDTVNLSINAIVATPFASLPVAFPGPIAPGNYFLEIYPAGSTACSSSSTDDLSGQIASIQNQPNPFGQQTLISVESKVTGDFLFQVFSLTGQRLHEQPLRLFEGSNQFNFDAGALPDGTYFYTLSNQEGKISRLMVVAK
jgi:hypothetical protein